MDESTSGGGVVGDSLDVSLLSPGEARTSGTVRLGVAVTNRTDRPLRLHLTGRPPAFDFIITDAGGRRVWSRLEGSVVPAILEVRTLAPGERLEFTDDWTPRTSQGVALAPGTYQVQGVLLTDDPGGLRTPPRTLRLTP